MKALVIAALLVLPMALLPVKSEAGFCGSKKKSKPSYYPVYSSLYWPAQTLPAHYFYYPYPVSVTYY